MIRLLKFLGRWSIRIALIPIGILLLFHTISYGVYLLKSPVPRLESYKAQYKLADQRYQWVYQRESDPISPVPYQIIWLGAKSAIKAHQRLLEWYPKESNDDVDVMEHVANLYAWTGQDEKALPYYQRQLEIFKEKHFLKDFKTVSDPINHYRFLARIRWNIANQFVKLGRYQDAIEEYHSLLHETEAMPGRIMMDRYEVIGQTLEREGKIYYKYLKEYDKAITCYKQVQIFFPDSLIISRSKTNIGDVYLAMGNMDGAKEIYKEVFKTYGKGEGGDWESASERLDSLQKNPNGPYRWIQ